MYSSGENEQQQQRLNGTDRYWKTIAAQVMGHFLVTFQLKLSRFFLGFTESTISTEDVWWSF